MEIFNIENQQADLSFSGSGFPLENEIPGWDQIISNAISRINFLTGNTEKEFLTIGESLQKYYQSAKEITKTSSSISSLIAEKVIKTGISELNDLLQRINSFLESSTGDIENGERSLQKILSVLGKASENLSGFKRIVKHLRMLGISTRIESARFREDEGGFNTLADNVEKLSSIINDKSTVIREKVNSLGNLIGQATSKLMALENRQREQTSAILKDVNLNLSALNARYDICSKKSEIVAEKSGNVSEHIGRIVSSIQFHDITRQQMEHVSQTLEALREKINQEVPETDAAVAAWGEQQQRQPDALIVYIHDVCNLQSMQLKHSKDELYRAVSLIIESLNEVRQSTSDILRETGQMFDNNSKGSGSSIITELKEGFSSISEALEKNSSIKGELTSSMRTIAGTVQELSRFVNEIEEIGSEIELIALNASVKAAHTGSEGAALGVLADSIQKLSHDAKTQTVMVSETLKTISEEAGKLFANISANAEDSQYKGLMEVIALLSSKTENLSEMDHNSMQTLNTISSNVVKLDDDICNLIKTIGVHDATVLDVEMITGNLGEIISMIQSRVDPSLLNGEDKLYDLQQQYTMNSERNIHRNYLSGGSGNFAAYNNEFPAADDELGSNVELF